MALSDQAPLGVSDLDIQATATPTIARTAGGLVLGGGALAVLTAGQTWSGFVVRGAVYSTLLAMLAMCGLAGAYVGLMLFRARAWAAKGATVAAIALFFMTSAWCVMSFAGGLVSFFAMTAPLVSFLSIPIAILSIAPIRRVAEARARLKASGFDLGT